MAMTNAEHQARFRQRRKDEIAFLRKEVSELKQLIETEVLPLLRKSLRKIAPPSEVSPLHPPSYLPPDSPPLADFRQLSPPLGETEKDNTSNANRRGKRLPLDWEPCEADRQFAAAAGIELDRETDRFRDYWHAKSGAAATKLDWCATWRNWCRKAAEDRPAARLNGYERAKREIIDAVNRYDSGGSDGSLWPA